MSKNVKPARMLIGGPSGCVGYTDEELRVLDEILNGGVSLRNTVVHRAMRIMCQAILNNPDAGYPGSLWELERMMGVQPSRPMPEHGYPAPPAPRPEAHAANLTGAVEAVTESDVEGTPDWMLEGSTSEPAALDTDEPKEEDLQISQQRQAISAFMG
ncbi:hypothetical protein [Marinobacter sp. C18]|uniref:hypothetical protein n=1 Tax=Marinobacter sp. C18 TaxID=1772288 RepID=UPI000948D0F1|nr:hypothetical protein [Marinobacter sp. C18]